MSCVDAVLVPFAFDAASCAAACSKALHCAGSTYTPSNECFFCGHGTVWGNVEQAVPKNTPVGCTFNATTNQRVCISCPGPPGVLAIQGFQSLRIANATLILSAACAYVAPAKSTDIFGAPGSAVYLADNNALKGRGQLLNPVEVRGDNVLVESVTVSSPILVRGRNAIIKDVRTISSLGAVKIVESDVGPLQIDNTTGTRAIVGVGHGEASISLTNCAAFPDKISFVLQEAKGNEFKLVITADDSCEPLQRVNLTSLLNVFGREYEVRFFNDGEYAHTGEPDMFEKIAWTFALNVVFGFNLYVLLGKEVLE